ncbi:MAG: hypothetical protein HQM16_13025 [Deltaproteobacteria bacterium]|nr:hypothetical protein [Deltaproteobacteria bacterium]
MKMSRKKWMIVFLSCLVCNFAVSYWVFNVIWPFWVLTAAQLSVYIYYKHRQRVYAEGLMAISPKNLFKEHEKWFYRQTKKEIQERTSQNAADLDGVLDQFNQDFIKSQTRFLSLTEDIAKMVAKSDDGVWAAIENKMDTILKELEREKDHLETIAREMESLPQQIIASNIINPRVETEKINKLLARLTVELKTPQKAIERRIDHELEDLNNKINKFRVDLDKRLKIRQRRKEGL